MARITGPYPDDLNLLIEGTDKAGVFGGKSDRYESSCVNTSKRTRTSGLQPRSLSTLGEAARLDAVNR